MNKSLLILINTMANGGAQRQVSLCASELAKLGWEVSVMHYGANGFAAEGLAERGVNIVKLSFRGPFRRLLVAIFCLRWILAKRPALVVSFLDAANQLCGLLRLLGFKFKWVPSERNLSTSISPFDVAWRKVLYRKADFVTCNSEAQSAWIRKLGLPREVVTVPNGIAPEFFKVRLRHRRLSPYRFIVLARLGAQKNPEVVLRALKLLPEGLRRDVHVDWFGDDDPSAPGLRERLKEETKRHCLPVAFHVATKSVAEELDASDCLILASRFEGTPNVMLEAMARSVPCIASAVSDIPAILGHGERGWLFRSDDGSDLARALVSFMCATEAQVLSVSANAREHVRRKFSTERMALTYTKKLSNSKTSTQEDHG